ncbi:MAG TPA: phosphatidate cytidylyltransferase [Anaerolineae bacterium]|nr:phosphatidate cytidylyltransferase [Anaerolineae bacterium]HQK15620.1 phosphatidate cytidylyltransferase [Anaerolineae bacterium]
MKTRFISAIILLPTVIAIIVIGSWPYILLISVATLLAGVEYIQMLKRKDYTLAWPCVFGFNLLWLADALWGNGQWLAPGMAGLTLLTAGWLLYRRQRHPEVTAPTAEWALTLAGGTYLGIGGAYLLRMRALPDGLWWTLTALPIVWVSESAAYFVGRRWGRHKMSPTISPGKSWEGYAGEVISGILMGGLCGWLWPAVAQQALSVTPGRGFLLGLVIAALTTAGDFFVSVIKREVGVKDTGTLIPGHGGMFDRIDSLLWTGFVTWTFVTLLP